jgi:aconitate hydratase
MTSVGHDTLNTRSPLDVGGRSYALYSIAKAASQLGDVSALN